MEKDRERLEKKQLSWDEFERRMDIIFQQIHNLIQDTNGTKNDR